MPPSVADALASPMHAHATRASRDLATLRFRATHLWLPLCAGLALVAVLQAGADQALADLLFRIEGGRWAWRDAPWLELGVHRVGRGLSTAAWLALALAWCTLPRRHTRLRQAMAYVLAAVALGTLAVSVMKALTGVDCPWDLARYGGTRVWHGLLEATAGQPRGRCFPAGHASAGYAWLALYFAARQVAPQRARGALLLALGAGLAFGIGQQLRGAHFASHDVASALACWLVSLALWRAWPWARAPGMRGRRMSRWLQRSVGPRARTWAMTSGQLAWAAAVFFSVTASAAFWREAWATGELQGWSGAWTALSLAVAIVASQALLLSLLLAGRAARPVLALLLVVAAAAAYFSWHYTVYLDDDMLRNILHTDVAESRELLGAGLWLHLAIFAGIPLVLLSRVRIVRMPIAQAVRRRLLQLAACAGLLVLGLALAFQQVSGLMHAHRDLRHLVAPANALVSVVRVLTHARDDHAPRAVVGADARLASPLPGRRPRVLVLVVGETVRAQNWGLNGYRRQTTPRLAAIDPVNFSDVTSCGSATEVSLPCMFSAVGRRDYDADRIERSESLLHVLRRAGVDVLWRDNQTGCKGVCDGLPFQSFRDATARCGGPCQDEVLLQGLPALLGGGSDRVIVLHMLGNHGPAYFHRYPAAGERFRPACRSEELADCSIAQIVNAYDNAILHTDALLARLVDTLAARGDVDTAMLYVSDHGESLGENGLFLHGVPYAIAPAVQTRVPMVLWLSPGFAADRHLDQACLRARARRPASHDNLFHTVLGLMDVATRDKVDALDLVAGCAHADARANAR